MARAKKTQEEKKQEAVPVIDQMITDTITENYMPYAMSVIVSRAIPEIDGFKPAHRKLLYTMYKMGLLTGGRVKSADVVGQTMGLNPHGDGAIYETLVRLTRGYDALLAPFIDSKGNFGKQYSRDMAYAASRYTEVKLAAVCTDVFRDIDKNTVDFTDNYNGKMKEPVLLPTAFPNVLVTHNQGIAVGMASSIASFNLKEVANAAIAYIKDKDCDIIKHLPAPDFSTGGELIYNEKDMRAIYDTGRGSFKLKAKYRFDKKNSVIEVYEIPYTTTIEAIIDKIAALLKNGKLRDITDVRDETDLNGLKIAIDIRRSSDPEQIMQKLFALTPLCDSFSCNFNILIDSKPRVMGIKEILEEWIIFRIGCITRQTQYDLEGRRAKLHLLNGLKEIFLDIDRAIAIIRNTAEEKMVVPNLMEGFSIDETQAEFIAEIKLRNLNREYILKQINEIERLEAEIDELTGILKSGDKINEIIISQLKECAKKYGQPRRTEIVYETEMPEITRETLIEDYPVRIFLTAHSYFKKIPHISLRSSGEQHLKDDDRILLAIDTTNKADIIFFSDKRNAYKARAYDLPDTKASSLGDYLTNLLKLDPDERIIFMTATTDYTGDLLFVFENGKAARVSLSSYQTKTNRKKLLNAYSDKAPLVYACHFTEDRDIIAIRGNANTMDKAMAFNTSLLGATAAKNSAGVQVFTLKKNSQVTHAAPVEDISLDDADYYRASKIPSTGHFIQRSDTEAFGRLS